MMLLLRFSGRPLSVGALRGLSAIWVQHIIIGFLEIVQKTSRPQYFSTNRHFTRTWKKPYLNCGQEFQGGSEWDILTACAAVVPRT